jgi:putative ABC transport system substrate-binding protein
MLKSLRWLPAVVAVAAAMAGCSSGGTSGSTASQSSHGSYTVGVAEIAQIGPITDMYAGFKEGLTKAGVDLKDVDFVEKNANGDQSVVRLIAQQMAQLKPDLILSLGTPVTLALGQQTKTVPIVFGAMTDPVGAQVVQSVEKPGGNLTGTSDYMDPSVLLDLLRQTLPNAKRIGIIANPSEQNSASQVDAIKNVAAREGSNVVVVPVSNSSEVAPAAQSLNGRVDVVFNTQDNTTGAAFDAAAKILYDASIPVIGVTGSRVKDGQAMASVGVDYKGLGIITGELAAGLLTGKSEPAKTPVVFPNSKQSDGLQYSVNSALAKHFGVTLPSELVSKADVYDSSPLIK